MSWKESVKLFLDYNLDMRRYVTGVFTGLTISLIILFGSGILWVSNGFFRWVASLTAQWVIPDISQDSLAVIGLSLTIVSMLLMLVLLFVRLLIALNQRGVEGESKSGDNETQMTRVLETLTELLQSMERQRAEDGQQAYRQDEPKPTGRTGEIALVAGYYQSLDSPDIMIHLEQGESFPETLVGPSPRERRMQGTTWRLSGKPVDASSSTDGLKKTDGLLWG